ncbi:hypothetical protein [Micromonospora zhanjiangensis]|uniref:Uncharacterized protein n=1 Tax=Micromonospora zhanjiangensis TaxID=1522057 RepID=A0ABV8KXP3_9ACTN
MLSDRRRRKGANRTRAGDGRLIEPFRWRHLLVGRRLFALPLVRPDGSRVTYLVDVRVSGKQAGGLGTVHLYLDGRHHAESPLPAVMPVEGGVLEVSLSSPGIRRAHFQPEGGAARQLTPHPRTAIGRRLRFDRDHPVLNRWVGAISVGMLIIGVGVNVLQLLEPLSLRFRRSHSNSGTSSRRCIYRSGSTSPWFLRLDLPAPSARCA